jgi:anti-sigma factor RsiW
MYCEEIEPLISGYMDREVDLLRSMEIERHLEICNFCKCMHQEGLALRSALREQAPYFSAPPALRRRLRSMVREHTQGRPRAIVLPWRWIAAAAAFALIFLLTIRVTSGPSHEQLLAQEIIAGHVRSLMANHVTDFSSSGDYHTVKPWFVGRIGFAPPIEDLAGQGFPLVGCRLDYVDGRRVAALVYQRRMHYVNLFVWPSADRRGGSALQEMRQGYNLFHWSQDGMTFWAVSDLAGDDMPTLVHLLQNETGPVSE